MSKLCISVVKLFLHDRQSIIDYHILIIIIASKDEANKVWNFDKASSFKK